MYFLDQVCHEECLNIFKSTANAPCVESPRRHTTQNCLVKNLHNKVVFTSVLIHFHEHCLKNSFTESSCIGIIKVIIDHTVILM